MNAQTNELAHRATLSDAQHASTLHGVSRLGAVDATRGLIMLLMALDHVGALVVRRHSSEYWGGLWTRYGQGDEVQFVWRLLSDLCAPGFFLWMGVGMAWFIANRTREGWSSAAVTRSFVLRGLLLIAIGQLIETPAWLLGILSATKRAVMSVPVPGGGGPLLAALGVLFALGASMILTSVLLTRVRTRPLLWIVLGGVLLLACNWLLPSAEHAGDTFAWWQRLLLVAGQGGVILFEYPVLPWLAIACFGIALGQLLEKPNGLRPRAVAWMGGACVIAGIVLRFVGEFGNTRLPRDDSWIEFFNLIKYPPSLIFTLLMVGGNLLLFGFFSGVAPRASRAVRILETFGRAPLFFYIAHLYLFAVIGSVFFREGTSYLVGLSVWAVGLIPLHYACAGFERFKRARPSSSVWRML